MQETRPCQHRPLRKDRQAQAWGSLAGSGIWKVSKKTHKLLHIKHLFAILIWLLYSE